MKYNSQSITDQEFPPNKEHILFIGVKWAWILILILPFNSYITIGHEENNSASDSHRVSEDSISKCM